MQARSGSGLLDPLMTGDPGAAGMRWLWALVADGGWPAGEGQGQDRSPWPRRAGTADSAAGSALLTAGEVLIGRTDGDPFDEPLGGVDRRPGVAAGRG
jgi:hypothetical protein